MRRCAGQIGPRPAPTQRCGRDPRLCCQNPGPREPSRGVRTQQQEPVPEEHLWASGTLPRRAWDVLGLGVAEPCGLGPLYRLCC